MDRNWPFCSLQVSILPFPCHCILKKVWNAYHWLLLIPLSTPVFSVSWAGQDWSCAKDFVSAKIQDFVKPAWKAFPSVFHRLESSSFRSQLKHHPFLKLCPSWPSHLRCAQIPSFFPRPLEIYYNLWLFMYAVDILSPQLNLSVPKGSGTLYPIYHITLLLQYQALNK